MQVDNDGLEEKIRLRVMHLPDADYLRVLDAYSGRGVLWSEIKRRTGRDLSVTRCDKKPGLPGLYVRGDNMKTLSAMDVKRFDVIDLDAYGSPVEQIAFVLDRGFAGIVFATICGHGLAPTPKVLTVGLGIPDEWYGVFSTKFSNGRANYKYHLQWLGSRGVRFHHRISKGMEDGEQLSGWKMYIAFDAGAAQGGVTDRVFENCKRNGVRIH